MKRVPLAMMAVAGLLLAACADHYDGNETWSSSVRNQALASPNADDLTITPNATGDKQTIAWPVVMGAGGYAFQLLDVGDENNPRVIAEKTIDGCSVVVDREEDVNYRISLRTLGNAELNNTEAASACVKDFTTFTETFATIEPGDLAQWFLDHPIPEDSVGVNLNYDLQAGGEYTLSQDLDFGNHIVTLRSTSKESHAKIVYSGDYSIITSTGMTMKYLDFDCTASAKSPVFQLSTTPDESIKGASGKGDYYNIFYNWTLMSCNFEGVNYQLFYDGDKKYCLETMTISNCNVHLTTDAQTNINGNAIIYFKTGFANYTYIQNSTFWNTGDGAARYFLQHGNNNRCDRASDDYLYNLVSYKNNTFYNLKCSQWSNYSGFAGRAASQWVCTNNIFYECGSQVARRLLGGRTASTYPSISFNNNTYWVDGEAENPESVGTYDTGILLQTDPAFVDAPNGNLTPTGAEQLEKRTGDPRWLTEQ